MLHILQPGTRIPWHRISDSVECCRHIDAWCKQFYPVCFTDVPDTSDKTWGPNAKKEENFDATVAYLPSFHSYPLISSLNLCVHI